MLQEETVQEVLARLARGERIKAIAREFGVDRKTVKRWRQLGQWRPRQGRARPCGLDAYMDRLAPLVE
jgi:transposase-like protein